MKKEIHQDLFRNSEIKMNQDFSGFFESLDYKQISMAQLESANIVYGMTVFDLFLQICYSLSYESYYKTFKVILFNVHYLTRFVQIMTIKFRLFYQNLFMKTKTVELKNNLAIFFSSSNPKCE